jgi:hypothetical protein
LVQAVRVARVVEAVVEAVLGAVAQAVLAVPAWPAPDPSAPDPSWVQSPSDYWLYENQISRVFIDQAVMALACDVTRVITVQYTNADSPSFPWLGISIPRAG